MNKKFIPLAFAASLIFAACSDDQTDVVNNGPEITFRTSVSRAKENIDSKNLKNFKVWAFANEVSSESAPFIDGLVAEREGTTDVFKFNHNIFWPNDIATLNFWALSPVDETLTVIPTSTSMSLKNYEPAAKPEDQLDLIAAFSSVTRGTTEGTSVALEFKHLLSQVLVGANVGVGVTEDRSVKIKGAWLVNIGTNATAVRDNNAPLTENKISWGKPSGTAAYGYYSTTIIEPNNHASVATPIFNFNKNDINADKTNLLLIPQTLTMWKAPGTSSGTETATETNASENGAYILLLCRVEAKHKGKLHGTEPDPMVKTITENGEEKHVHQMFPHDGEATEFEENAYGFTCVPIGSTWEPGKIYRYILDICGKNSGAGLYPPVDLPDLPGLPTDPSPIKIIKTPGADKVGKPVLDEPIKFTVTVNDWADPEDWNSGVDLQ